jgi:RNA polymerase sigma factor (sigma-70 family)
MDEGTSPQKKSGLTKEAFDKLLACLDPDRQRAGERYETIRRKLMKFFETRGGLFPEDLADETINRVARKIDQGEEIRNPESYFFGVARRVLQESWRAQPPRHQQWQLSDHHQSEQRLECLQECLQKLPPESRPLVIEYYQAEGSAKIEGRKKLAERLKIPLDALRHRVHRLREKLEACVSDCLQKKMG